MILTFLNKQSFSVAKIRWCLFVATAIMLILFVILMGLLRLALPYLTSYEDEIKASLQDMLNHPVTFTRIDAGWHWFSPQLKLVNLDVLEKNKKSQLIRFREVVFEFNVISNVINFRFEPSVVSLNGAVLDIEKDKKGVFYLQGVHLEAGQGNQRNTGSYDKVLSLLDDKELRLVNTTLRWTDKTRDSKPQRYKNLNMSVQVSDSGFLLDVEADIPKKIGQRIHLIADVSKEEKDWLSVLYINADELNLSSVMNYIEVPDISVSSKLNTELWVDLKNLQLEKIAGKFSASDINVVSTKKAVRKTWSSRRISSAFQVERLNDEWRVVVDKFNVALENKKWNDVYFSLKYKESDSSLDARFGYLDLSGLGDIVAKLPLDSSWVTTVLGINPKGELSNTELHIDDWKKANNWVLKTNFNNLGLKIPGQSIRLDGLSGSLSLDKSNGRLELNSKNAVFESKFFNKPLLLSRLTSDIDLKKIDNDYQLSSDSILATLDGVEIQSRINYAVGEKSFLDLQVDFSGANASWLNSHRTDNLFGKNTAEWLSDSILEGDFKSAGIMYYGLINDFPFKNNEGVFQAIVEANKVKLKYQPDWPEITGIEARFFMENNKIVIDRASGYLNKNTLITNSVTTINLSANTHVLVAGQVDTNADDVNDFFVATPLRKGYRDIVKHVAIDGKLKTNLKLDIPLNSNEEVNVSGDVVLNNNKIRVRGLGYTVKQANGVVHFNNSKIDSKNLTGMFNGNQATAVLETSRIDSVNNTLLKAKLKSDVASLVPSGTSVEGLFNGQVNWGLELGVFHQTKPGDKIISLNLRSDLTGLESNLPLPFSKKADMKADFELDLDLYDASTALLLHYDDKVNMSMRWNEGFKDVRSDIQVFNGPFRARKDGVNITAKIKDLDTKEWKDVVSPFFKKSSKTVSFGNKVNIDLSVDLLQHELYKLNDVDLKAEFDHDEWFIDISSDEAVGKITLPQYINNDVPLVMSFKKLDLSTLLGFEKGKEVSKNRSLQFSPKDIPPLKIQASNFSYEDYKFEDMRLVTSQTSYGLTVHTLDVKGENLSLKLKGNWFSKQNSADNSNFRIEVESDNVGHMLSFYNFSKSIKKGSGKAVIDWQWAASPLDFDWNLVSGRMQLDVANGQFTDVEPGAGRLLGMFSLRALPKRFFLDFSDTFSEGFEFNTINSSANFSRGHLYTSNTHLAGDSADVYFRGRIGLADKDYDQIMSVIPRISSGVSGWVAIAQGAVVGLTVYIGQKLLGVDEAAKNQYHISGSWSDPVINKMGKTIDESSEINNENE